MVKTKIYRREYERSIIEDAAIEDWFAARDWVAAGGEI